MRPPGAADIQSAQTCGLERCLRQCRSVSLLEACTNVAIGFMLTFVVQGLLYPALGIVTTPETNFVIAVVFTMLSLARSYAVRRAFEYAGSL